MQRRTIFSWRASADINPACFTERREERTSSYEYEMPISHLRVYIFRDICSEIWIFDAKIFLKLCLRTLAWVTTNINFTWSNWLYFEEHTESHSMIASEKTSHCVACTMFYVPSTVVVLWPHCMPAFMH